jgi:purine-nucleoside phosphorylase
VSGHNPHLHIGMLEGVRVAVFGAREHYYENGNPPRCARALEVLRALGARELIATNAAGRCARHPARRPDAAVRPHQLFNGLNPLIGEKTDARFVPMTDAHSTRDLRAALKAAAAAEASPCPKASMPGIPGQASKPRPKSACSRCWAAMRWACPRCPR